MGQTFRSETDGYPLNAYENDDSTRTPPGTSGAGPALYAARTARNCVNVTEYRTDFVVT